MAELATIARPYAEALFKSAGGQASADAEWLNELALIAEQPQLQQFADNPKVTHDQVFGLLASVVKSKMSDRANNFLRTLIDNNRLPVLPEIARQFHALVNAQHASLTRTSKAPFLWKGLNWLRSSRFWKSVLDASSMCRWTCKPI